MPSVGRLLVMLLLSFLVTLGLATAALSPRDWHLRPYQNGDVVRKGGPAPEDRGSLTSLLDKASPNSLHELLHKYFPERFKDGVWESDVSAVEAVRRADPALADSIVQLARRQADNGTSTTEPPPPDSTTSKPPPPDSTTSPPPDDNTGTTTPPSTSTPPTTTPPSSTTGRTSTTTTPRTSSTTGPPSSTSRTTTTDRPTTSPGTSNTITNRPGPSTTPTLRPVTSTFTSTDAGGGVVVVTTTTWVSADPVQTGPTSSRPSPTLQSAAGPSLQQNRWAHVALLGVVVGAVLLI
ncbi:hypothetical protein GE09DRAFT_1219762 [Coniochaeta sp. 2T2.1]|nr:hypothetical protein GE09DRAFT_1219762 [Coniochaeta sp. 2T2.1]